MTKFEPLNASKKLRLNVVLAVAQALRVPIIVQGQYFPKYPCAPCIKPSSTP